MNEDGDFVYRRVESREECNEVFDRDHELRASLAGIEAVAVALNEQRDCLSSGDVDKLALAIASEARRLRLMLAAPDAERTSFNLAEAIQSAIVMTRASGVIVRNDVPIGIRVHGRRDDLAQVALALMDNARIHAAPSAIDVRARVHDGTTTLYIEDRGRGMTQADGDRMFERGRRSARSPGSGLGLYIARRLMLEQTGSLSVEPRPGGGASFVVSLPSAPSISSRRRRTVVRHEAALP